MQRNNLYRIKNATRLFLLINWVGISMLGFAFPLNVHNSTIKTIVIDAGHGGKDPGCSGAHSVEKTIALDIALQAGALIEAQWPNVAVIYTRKDDRFVELWKRADIANKANADLFISVHCNAHYNKEVHGAQTFVMGLHKNEDNLEVSERENNVRVLEADSFSQKHYEEINPNTPEGQIVLSLYQSAYLEQSVDLGAAIQDQVRAKNELRDLGVIQAGFVVLWKTAMASVLVETGYLTNMSDEAYLTSQKGKTESAENIFEAVKEYKQRLENR